MRFLASLFYALAVLAFATMPAHAATWAYGKNRGSFTVANNVSTTTTWDSDSFEAIDYTSGYLYVDVVAVGATQTVTPRIQVFFETAGWVSVCDFRSSADAQQTFTTPATDKLFYINTMIGRNTSNTAGVCEVPLGRQWRLRMGISVAETFTFNAYFLPVGGNP